MCENYQARRLDDSVIIEPNDAVTQFESFGGRLTIFSPFGEDPLKESMQLSSRREEEFKERYPDFSQFFYRIVNGDNSLFREGLLFFIDISKRLEASV